jgi:hypothetical protein
MPAWRDIRPTAIGRFLPNVWAWRLDPASGDFVGRLAGEIFIQLLGGNPRGMRAQQYYATRGGSYMVDLFHEVARRRVIAFQEGNIFIFAGRHGRGQRLILPLSGDGMAVDGLLGVSAYRFPRGSSADDAWYFNDEVPAVEFYPIGEVQIGGASNDAAIVQPEGI